MISAQSFPSACQASDRVLVETRNITVSGKTLQISKKACSADIVAPRSLEKRQVLESCECFTGPVLEDCVELTTSLELSSEPEFFEVAPGFAETFTFQTCGPTLEFCFSGMELLGGDLESCTEGAGAIGGFAIPSDFGANAADTWTFEFVFSVSNGKYHADRNIDFSALKFLLSHLSPWAVKFGLPIKDDI
ncbi:hypothetical protein BDP27DRAFT_1360149 [Rhodocollybia butyracea]|uniref:Uncharacterized protein n=1 Tax=Rhodocollybia butyracea TaxID=206335 RepID=A0A9P5PW04_9AGAR|nr:hypothetical protein BDP27DRAFT_1360149 [Rhodocollybia butyracea]